MHDPGHPGPPRYPGQPTFPRPPPGRHQRQTRPAPQQPPAPNIGIGRGHAGTHALLLIREFNIRVIADETGELIREVELDPTRDYQPTGKDRTLAGATNPTRRELSPDTGSTMS
jgi:hypothetical protein